MSDNHNQEPSPEQKLDKEELRPLLLEAERLLGNIVSEVPEPVISVEELRATFGYLEEEYPGIIEAMQSEVAIRDASFTGSLHELVYVAQRFSTRSGGETRVKTLEHNLGLSTELVQVADSALVRIWTDENDNIVEYLFSPGQEIIGGASANLPSEKPTPDTQPSLEVRIQGHRERLRTDLLLSEVDPAFTAPDLFKMLAILEGIKDPSQHITRVLHGTLHTG